MVFRNTTWSRTSIKQLRDIFHLKSPSFLIRNSRHASDKGPANLANLPSGQTASTSAKSAPKGIPGPSWAWIEPFTNSPPIRAYSAMQKRSPLLTQFESALVIYFVGDLSAQLVSTSAWADGEYEPIRGVRAMIIGGISSIPSYKWFLFLGRNFNLSSHWASIALKIGINQTFFTPVFNSYFFGMQSLLSGNSWEKTVERIKETVPTSWKNSWKLWPAVTAFSFTYIQPQNRNVFAGVIAVGWQTYLSWLNKQAEQAEKEC